MGAASHPPFALALGGGGARGIAHIHVLEAMDELGVRPARIAGSSIGAMMGAGYAAGLTGADIRAHTLETFVHRRAVAARVWQARPTSLRDFFADGGVRFGQLNAVRLLKVFLPSAIPERFEDLSIPLGVMATDFFAHVECEIDSGDLVSALAGSIALPAVFRPVRREDRVLIDGGIFNPLPFDRLSGQGRAVVAVDVNGAPQARGGLLPTPMEAMVGASQLMMMSIIETKLRVDPPDLVFRPDVSAFRVFDFLRTPEILSATSGLKEDAKRALARLLDRPGAEAGRSGAAARETAVAVI
ncbi:patatin-like phospholipase family protein [Aurantimonas sp. Leaf443]|uniref:patatin-like phospholipase family protein n=1 Tax=Aurantimonas sp. Leaf443 TaxID=1736378 RepID=UPI0006FA3D70|nr:patatin-like phospholipase family protein [Aurantimonas sp. Leaf443]KQT87975.1 Patatin [Aurantimonas sp. Leaf443]